MSAQTVGRVATDFDRPIDAVAVENVVYVIEYGNPYSPGGRRSVQAVMLPRTGTTTPPGPEAAVRLAAFPHPAAGALDIRYAVGAPADARVDLLDVLGRVVWTADASGPGGRLDVDTADLPAGVYVARLTAGPVRVPSPVAVVR